MDNESTPSTDQKAAQLEVTGMQARWALIVCSLLYMINCMDRQVLAAVLEPMKQDLMLSDTQTGVIQSAFLLSIAIFAFPGSYIVDRWSRRKAISLMALVWSVFTFVTGLGRSFIGVLLPRTLVGVGEAGFTPGGTALITAVYPPAKRGRAMGFFNAAIPLGMGLGAILGGFISANMGGWRTPFYIFAAPGVILGVAAWFLKDYKTVKELDESGRNIGLFRAGISLYRIPTLRWVYLGNAMMTVTAYSFLTWGPAYVMRVQGINEEKAGLLIGILSLMAIIGAPLGGFIADQWQKKNPRGRILAPAFSLLIMTGFYLLTIELELKGPGLVVGLIFGVLLVVPIPAIGAITQDVVRPGQKGMAFGMNTFSMYILGGGWAPTAIGWISDSMGGGAHGLKTALMFAGVGGISGALFLFLGARHYMRDVDRVQGFKLETDH